MSSYDRGVMTVDVGDPYTYLWDLAYNKPHMQNTANRVFGVLNGVSGLTPERIELAINFLGQSADIQRQHEISFIQNQINQLRKTSDGTEIEKIIAALESATSGENFNYKSFMEALNGAIRGIEEYKARLKTLADPEQKMLGIRNIANDVQTTVNHYAQRRSQFYFSQEELIRSLIIKFWESDAGQQYLTNNGGHAGALNIVAASAILQNELTQYIYETGMLTYTDEYYPDDKTFLEELDKYYEQLQDFFSSNEKVLYNQQLLEDVKKLYGLNIAYKKAPDQTPQSRELESQIKDIREKIGDPFKNQDRYFKSAMKRIRVTGNKKAYALQNELGSIFRNAFSSHAHMGAFRSGTDILLGSFITTASMPTAHDPAAETLNNIKIRIKAEKAANNVEKTNKIYQEEFEKLENMLGKLDKAFVIHESTKFYLTMEDGRKGHGVGYHGRKMNLFNYIDSMASFGSAMGADTQWLQFVAYNLGDGALGDGFVPELEEYFAIAAGIIMFDDFSLAAKELTQSTQGQSIENIHLYKLNDVYVPSSYFLQAVYNALTGIYDEITAGNAFTAKITAPGHGTYSRDYSQSLESQWGTVRDKASQVTITLSFAAHFLDLIGKLLG